VTDNLYRVAIVQPHTYSRTWGEIFPFPFEDSAPPETRNLDDALGYIGEAAGAGARFVAFPEMYPGPMSVDSPFSLDAVTEQLAAQARKSSIWVLYGGAEVTPDGLYNTYNVINPAGELTARYRKMIPACGEPWLPGSQPVVVKAGGLRIGLAICWEAWFPEVARTLTFMGADLIFFPTGALVYELAPRWRQVLAARAAENIVYTAASVNLLALEDGMAVINSPEETLVESTAPGLIVADVDLDRLVYLRRTDEQLIVPKKYRSIPGLTRALRPELLDQLRQAAGGSGGLTETHKG
jgi:predicted amidohydrolase